MEDLFIYVVGFLAELEELKSTVVDTNLALFDDYWIL